MALLSKNAKSLPLDLLKTKKYDREPWRLKKFSRVQIQELIFDVIRYHSLREGALREWFEQY